MSKTKTSEGQDSSTIDVQVESTPSDEAIAVAAYYRAEKRGFAPGGDLDDWIEAEGELKQSSTIK